MSLNISVRLRDFIPLRVHYTFSYKYEGMQMYLLHAIFVEFISLTVHLFLIFISEKIQKLECIYITIFAIKVFSYFINDLIFNYTLYI